MVASWSWRTQVIRRRIPVLCSFFCRCCCIFIIYLFIVWCVSLNVDILSFVCPFVCAVLIFGLPETHFYLFPFSKMCLAFAHIHCGIPQQYKISVALPNNRRPKFCALGKEVENGPIVGILHFSSFFFLSFILFTQNIFIFFLLFFLCIRSLSEWK